MVLHPSGKPSQKAYMNARLAALDGETIDFALNGFRYETDDGKEKKYNYGDLKYDIKCGYLNDPR
jgi:hypothetical protein